MANVQKVGNTNADRAVEQAKQRCRTQLVGGRMLHALWEMPTLSYKTKPTQALEPELYLRQLLEQ